MKITRASVSVRGSSKNTGFVIGLMKQSKRWSLERNQPASGQLEQPHSSSRDAIE